MHDLLLVAVPHGAEELKCDLLDFALLQRSTGTDASVHKVVQVLFSSIVSDNFNLFLVMENSEYFHHILTPSHAL